LDLVGFFVDETVRRPFFFSGGASVIYWLLWLARGA